MVFVSAGSSGYLSQPYDRPLHPAWSKTSFLPFINIPPRPPSTTTTSLSLCCPHPSNISKRPAHSRVWYSITCNFVADLSRSAESSGEQSVAFRQWKCQAVCGTSWGTDHYIYRDGRLDLHCTLSISHFSAAPLDTEYSIMDLSCSAVS